MQQCQLGSYPSYVGALKTVPGMKRFMLYFAFVIAFSLVAGLIVNAVI